MNGTKQGWLDAILRCMKQDKYGDKYACELCKKAGYLGDPRCDPVPKCRNCVVDNYFNEDDFPAGLEGFPCYKILDASNVEFDDDGVIRQILQQVYDWLKPKKLCEDCGSPVDLGNDEYGELQNRFMCHRCFDKRNESWGVD